MDKTPGNMATGATSTSPAETRTLRDVVYNSKRSGGGGNYGSLAKSQVQAIFYISHKVESTDTLQRLALKYSSNIQEIKRVNKLWSDAELGLREQVYIPVNSNQLSTLRTEYPNLEIVQSLTSSPNSRHKASFSTPTDDEAGASMQSSDSTTSITTTTNNTTYQDYLSKIDQQIRSTKDSLQAFDIKEVFPNSQTTNTETNPSNSTPPTMSKNDRHKGVHHLTDNSAFVNISTQNISRDKHVSAALKRLQQEQDNSDEL